MEMKSLIILLLVGIIISCQKKVNQEKGQEVEIKQPLIQKRTSSGEEVAKQFLEEAQKGQLESSAYFKANPLISDKETAAALAEVVLFKVYGKENIIDERPYEVYKINQYWILFGTLPRDMKGGTFQIALDGTDGRVIGLIHGK